jgi:hypothetical protein
MTAVALMIDSRGSLNAASPGPGPGTGSGSAAGWQGPVAIGTATLVPGAPVAVFQQSATVFTALMIDQDGILNSASLDTSTTPGWQGPVAIGTAILVPGAPVTVIPQAGAVFAALMVDRDGTLNVATLDTSAGTGWQGPVGVGNAGLFPGSRIAAAAA